MRHRVERVTAQEILDSRGRPTLQVTVRLAGGGSGVAGVPSGASTGSGEAVELRDGDPDRFAGAGVLRACAHVDDEIDGLLAGRDWGSIGEVDDALIELDGTAHKHRLGANAIVGTSMAMAAASGRPLWRWLCPDREHRLPVPHFNVLNGGVHAQNPLEPQELMIAPRGAASYSEALRVGAEVYQALRRLLGDAGLSTGLGDEGGFAPELAQPEKALDLLVTAIDAAGFAAAVDGVAIALDPAASELREPDGRYRWAPGELLTTGELIDRYVALVERYPIWSIEDGVGEDDRAGWQQLTARLGSRVQLVGDDNFVTDPARIRDAAEHGIANAALIKVNQIGTVSETLAAVDVCRAAGYGQMVSHRSGETTDAFIADLAVAVGCGQLKSGAPCRGERVAKYNRLLEIEADAGDCRTA